MRIGATISLAVMMIWLSAQTASATVGHAPLLSASTPGTASDSPVKYYVVKPAHRGEPEFLFAIAERLLRNGERWPEIFELNKDRIQPDGGRLTDPTALEPGWVLQLPADARGKLVQTGVLPEVTPAPSSAPTPAAPAGSNAQADPNTQSTSLFWIIGGAAILLGGGLISFALVSRSRSVPVPGPAPTPPPRRTPPAPRGPAYRAAATPEINAQNATDSGVPKARRKLFGRVAPDVVGVRQFDAAAAWTVDRGLLSLSGLAGHARRTVPPFYAVVLDREWMQLRLATPDHDAPAPWSADEGGRNWAAPLRALQALPLEEGLASPSPRLVTLGSDDGARVLVDLGQATGVISVEGNTANVQSLLRGWVGELLAAPWAEQVRVVTVGLAPPTAPTDVPGPERIEYLPGLHEAFGAIGWSDGDSVAGVLRGSGNAATQVPGVLIVSGRFRETDLEQLQALASQPDANWTVVIAGRVPAARWRFTLRPGGRLDTGVLGITTQVNDGLASTPGIR